MTKRDVPDHRVIRLNVPVTKKGKGGKTVMPKRGPSWIRPEGIRAEEWRQFLKGIWGKRPTEEWWERDAGHRGGDMDRIHDADG